MRTTKQNGYAPVNGLKMYYEISGKGAPLVLIHGGGSTIESNFGNLIPVLARRFKIIALELQAHGHTNDRNAAESFEQDARDVAALMDFLKVRQAHVLGFSNGGTTAMVLANRFPEKIDRLVIASAFYQRAGLIAGLLQGLQAATLNDMPQPLRQAFLKANPNDEALQNMFNKDRERMVNFVDWEDNFLQSIKAETLIIAGDRDICTPEHTINMHRLISNSRLMILPSSHGSYLGEVADMKTGSKMHNYVGMMIADFLDPASA